MNVVWDYDERMYVKAVPVPAKACLRHYVAGTVRKDPTSRSTKGHEEDLAVGLEVRKFAAVVIAALHGSVLSGRSEWRGDSGHTCFVMNPLWTGGAPVSPPS